MTAVHPVDLDEHADNQFAKDEGLVWMEQTSIGLANNVREIDQAIDFHMIRDVFGATSARQARRSVLHAARLAWERYDGGNIDHWFTHQVPPCDMPAYIDALVDCGWTIEESRTHVVEQLLWFIKHQIGAALNVHPDLVLEAVLALG